MTESALTTSRNSNLPLVEYLADHLSGHSISTLLTPSEGVVRSGHSDVLPIDGQDCSTGPLVLTEADGNCHGRGSSDIKSFITCALEIMRRYAAMGLQRTIHFALSHDEEVGCLGVGRYI